VAKNAAGITTENYYQDSQGSVDDFMKLTASEINITAPTTDASNTGVNSSLLPITSLMSTGTLSQTSDRGVLEYQFSDNDHFYYQRSSNAIVAPFLSDINFNIANITSATDQNITATTLNDVTTTSGISIRFGRLFIENSFGPETANLTQPFKTQYWDGSQFVVNNDDNCSAFDSSKMSLTNISLDPALTGLSVDNGSVVSGSTNRLILQAPGEGNTGAVQVDYDSFDWLKYNWSGSGSVTENPSAIATFGVFRGNDRIINWREVDN
jgi:MSHA biogenesis protein MshQ